ncbi:hypothetical protein E1293_23245 [Actinomadura darangshiensis]|uniref:Uncharacterized protein n=1 Tax=Actinomadura darangshiensis TaxID=705336 RepID=A0A4R5B783_9ACTN|nr:hypothetical protein [Actinomadura darangshiensis]TDD79514.1 hypothetical protein E1293_23245 [Actinomadura darangshiensis]
MWKIPVGVLLLGLAEWGLLAAPSTRLIGMVLLAVLLGFFITLGLMGFTVGIVLGPLIERWGLRGFVLAGVCVSVGVLAMIGSVERARPGYVWKYGEPTQVTISRDTSCTLSGYKCYGSWTSAGRTVGGAVTFSREEYHAPEDDGSYRLRARALDNRAASAGLHIDPASSVALGKIPAWIGWGAGGVGLAAVAVAMLTARKPSPPDR